MTQRFTRPQRLLKTDEFSSVFSLRRTQANAFFQVWSQPNQLGHARLGLVVGKKADKRAVGRNYIKRTVRECFRQQAAMLSSVDLVVRAKRPVHRSEGAAAREALRKLLARFAPCPAS